MKKITLFLVAALFSVLSFAALNPYAYGLSSTLDGTTLTVNYSLNSAATGVSVVILDGAEEVKTVTCDGKTKGSHSVEISTIGLPTNKSLTWKVVVTGNSVASPTLHDESIRFFLPYGMDVDVDPESDYMGNWYVIEASNDGKAKTGYQCNPFGRGLYAFDATLNPILNSADTRGFTGGVNAGYTEKNVNGDFVNFYRVATSGGRVFIGKFRNGHAAIVEANPANLNQNFTEIVNDGKRAVSIDVRGSGEDLKLVMLDLDYNMYEYDLGTAKSIAAPSRTIDRGTLNIVRNDATIAYDNEGGIWLNQNRSTATETCPTIAHISLDNGFDYNNISDGIAHNNTNNSGIAVSPDGKKLAVVGAGSKKLTIYDISKVDGQIKLTQAHVITVSAGDNHTALAWDYAGNLFAANRSSERIRIFAMPYSGTVATPCASKYAFELQESIGTIYTVTATASPAEAGTVAGAGEYAQDTEVTLTATANTGYRFENWTVGSNTETANPLTFTITENITATANFVALTPYTINATANDANMGTVTGGGTYYEGETVTLTATPKTGYRFVNWSNSSTDAKLTFTASENLDLTANFEICTYTLTSFSNDETKGTVSGAGTYNYGATATLTATPTDGYKLLYWSDRSTENPRTITMAKNEAISAYFVKIYDEEPTFTITKVWENTNVPASTTNGYQAVGWDGKIYMQNRTAGKIITYSSAEDTGTDYATSGSGQQIAVDEAGNLIVFNAYFATSNPANILIYKKGSTIGTEVSFTLQQAEQCHFFSASGNIYSAE